MNKFMSNYGKNSPSQSIGFTVGTMDKYGEYHDFESEFKSFKAEFSQYSNNPMLFSFCLTTIRTMWENGYLSDKLTPDMIETMEYGESICVFSHTGSGKSNAIKNIAQNINKNELVIILTNRKACVTQLIKETFGEDVSEEILEKINSMIKIMTYQKFAHLRHQYQGKKITLICDECHCFAEDATFSCYPKQIAMFLQSNHENTKRIYMTATPDDVLTVIWNIEKTDGQKFPSPTEDCENFIKSEYHDESICIQHIYMKKPDWNYLEFKFYDPDKRDVLIDYINQICSKGQKALVFINDKEKGAAMQEKLPDCQHIYSDEDKTAEIHEIAVSNYFQSDVLVTTKVAGNGLSLHDDSLTLIIAEHFDPVAIQQIIGRARNPKHLTVLIPDYKANHLGSIEGKLLMQLKEFQWVKDNPDFAMEKYCHTDNPYVYYDGNFKKPVVNDIGHSQIKRQLEYVQQLKQEELENPHAHIRRIMSLYGKTAENIDEMFIDYNSKKECIDRIHEAWKTFKASQRTDADLSILKEALKSACNETGAYGKELKSNIQIDTINKVLAFAGVKDRLQSGRTVFGINSTDENN